MSRSNQQSLLLLLLLSLLRCSCYVQLESPAVQYQMLWGEDKAAAALKLLGFTVSVA